jgi:rhodanese-related sulfurtransferase
MSSTLQQNCTISPAGIPELTVNQVFENLSNLKIIDVRRADEFTGELGHIEGAMLKTLDAELTDYLKTADRAASYAFVCRSGGRSGVATQQALELGFKSVVNMKGGMLAWNAAGLKIER